MKNKNILFVIGNSLAVIFTIIINALANILPINNKYTGQLSDNIPNLFVPTGLTFAIWGIIYILIILFMFYQINEVFIKKKNPEYIEKIGFYFMLASLANIIWIFMWHYEQVTISIVPMFVLFISLLMIYQRLEIGKTKTSLKEKMFIHTPISVYIGWITVATIANVTAVLVVNNAGDLFLGEMIWTILVILVAALITILVLKDRKDIAYSLVIIWALLGIMLKRFQLNEYIEIAYASAICIILIAVIMLVTVFMHNKKPEKT
jgi:hypothetical protein